jgi:prolipoprotein diacylglyceryltransferase
MHQVLFRIPIWLGLSLLLTFVFGMSPWMKRPEAEQGTKVVPVRRKLVWSLLGAVVAGLLPVVARFGLADSPSWAAQLGWLGWSIPIFGFGVMLCLAFLLCTWMGGYRARRVGIPPESIQDLAIWVFVGGIIGARLLFLFLEVRPRPAPLEMLYLLPQIWTGGIILYGAVVGALIAYVGAWYFIFRPRRIPTLLLADVVAPAVALGVCLGRIGCFLNGCCFGQVACPECAVWPAVHYPLSAPSRELLVHKGWQTAAGFTYADQQPQLGVKVGKVFPDSPAWQSGLRPGDVIVGVDGHRVAELGEERWPPVSDVTRFSNYLDNLAHWQGQPYLTLAVTREGEQAPVTLPPFAPVTLGLYPTQLYESVSMALMILVLLAYEPLRKARGQVMAVLMMGYAVHRYLNELLRIDPRPQGVESYSSVVLFAAGLGMWLWLHFRARTTQPAKLATAVAGAARGAPQDGICHLDNPKGTFKNEVGRPRSASKAKRVR